MLLFKIIQVISTNAVEYADQFDGMVYSGISSMGNEEIRRETGDMVSMAFALQPASGDSRSFFNCDPFVPGNSNEFLCCYLDMDDLRPYLPEFITSNFAITFTTELLANEEITYCGNIRTAGQRIVFVFLPACSPNLNLMKRLRHFLRQEAIHSIYYHTCDKFRNAIIHFLQHIKEHNEALRKLLTSNSRTVGNSSIYLAQTTS